MRSPATPRMASTDRQPEPAKLLCNYSALAGTESQFPHWHFCQLQPRHTGRHRCVSCQAEFGPTPPPLAEPKNAEISGQED
jgi:hypothetical protein